MDVRDAAIAHICGARQRASRVSATLQELHLRYLRSFMTDTTSTIRGIPTTLLQEWVPTSTTTQDIICTGPQITQIAIILRGILQYHIDTGEDCPASVSPGRVCTLHGAADTTQLIALFGHHAVSGQGLYIKTHTAPQIDRQFSVEHHQTAQHAWPGIRNAANHSRKSSGYIPIDRACISRHTQLSRPHPSTARGATKNSACTPRHAQRCAV